VKDAIAAKRNEILGGSFKVPLIETRSK